MQLRLGQRLVEQRPGVFHGQAARRGKFRDEGRMTSEQYPTADVAGPNLGLTFDDAGRVPKGPAVRSSASVHLNDTRMIAGETKSKRSK